jgi:hypothetical protein
MEGRWLMTDLDSWNDEAIKQAYDPDAPEHLKGFPSRITIPSLFGSGNNAVIAEEVMTTRCISQCLDVEGRWLMTDLDSWNDEAIKQAYDPDAPEHLKGFFGC